MKCETCNGTGLTKGELLYDGVARSTPKHCYRCNGRGYRLHGAQLTIAHQELWIAVMMLVLGIRRLADGWFGEAFTSLALAEEHCDHALRIIGEEDPNA